MPAEIRDAIIADEARNKPALRLSAIASGRPKVERTRMELQVTHKIQTRLKELQVESALASLEGLASDSAYMADLREEIAAESHAYVGAAVTEVATLRAQLSGPQVG